MYSRLIYNLPEAADYVNAWFPDQRLQSTFLDVQGLPGIRVFLNLLNSSLGARQQVFSYAAVSCYLGDRQLVPLPGLDQLWLDFSCGSRSLVVYCLVEGVEGAQPTTFTIPDNIVRRVKGNPDVYILYIGLI